MKGLAAIFIVMISAGSAFGEKVDYSRDVLPILSANCFVCHGRDASTRQEDLRLDLRDEATRKRDDKTTPIVAGKPEVSELIARITSKDDEVRMPKPERGRALSDQQVDVIRRWIAEGAEYNEHWAFKPATRPAVPEVSDAGWGKNEIDRFVLARLEREKLAPAKTAGKEALIRRATLDLIGLPPTPEEIEAFEADASPDAYGKLVERLLASPHYGERYGRHWLDMARYADSGGFETDIFFGHAWRYRDYVIRSFNADKPFDRFVKEQIAGDELYPGDQEALLATGLYTTGPVLQEAGMVAGKLEYDQLTDAVDTTGSAFLGMTVGCARCHDHKYDPISQKEYYGLQAVFAPSDEIDIDSYGTKLRERAALKNTQKEFESEQARARVGKETDPARRDELLRKTGDAFIEADKELKARVDATKRYDIVKAAVERYNLVAAGKSAGGDADDPLATDADDNNDALALKALLGGIRGELHEPKDVALMNVGIIAYMNPAPRMGGGGGGQGARRRNGGGQRGAATQRAVAGQGGTTRPAVAVAEVVETGEATTQPVKDATTQRAGDVTLQQPSDKVTGRAIGANSRRAFAALKTDVERRDFLLELAKQNLEISKPAGYVENIDSMRLELGKKHLGDPSAIPVRVLGHREKPLVVHLLKRGELEDPGDVVPAGLPEKLSPGFGFDADINHRRAGLANWIASDRNLFTARVIANRVWQWHFGEGLVRTPNDFGVNGDRPTHPELLDWLATALVEHGWSLKYLNRVIMNSAAYQMAPLVDEGTLARDPENRLLTRFQPRRLEAEVVWDSLRADAGSLDLTMYGMPIAPPLDAQEQLGNYRKWPTSTPDEANRRAVYILVKRSFRFPMLSAFDLPDNISSCGRRDITTVPNQALTLLNNSTMRRHAAAFADRLLKETHSDLNAVPGRAWLYAFGRSPTEQERTEAKAFMEEWTAKNPGLKPAVTELCLALFNTNEFIYLQ